MQDGVTVRTNNYSIDALDGVFEKTKILASKVSGLMSL
jgi:hypothetical protein